MAELVLRQHGMHAAQTPDAFVIATALGHVAIHAAETQLTHYPRLSAALHCFPTVDFARDVDPAQHHAAPTAGARRRFQS